MANFRRFKRKGIGRFYLILGVFVGWLMFYIALMLIHHLTNKFKIMKKIEVETVLKYVVIALITIIGIALVVHAIQNPEVKFEF